MKTKLIAICIGCTTLTFGGFLVHNVLAQQKIVMSGAEASKTLSKKRLEGLFSHLKDTHDELPSINSENFCSTLTNDEKTNCLDSKTFGLELYSQVREFNTSLKKASLADFEVGIQNLGILRDDLWRTQSAGGVLLADTINRVIYWQIATRLTTAPAKDLNRVDGLRKHYRPLINDWKTIVATVDKEFTANIDVGAVENPGSKERKTRETIGMLDRSQINPLSLKYLELIEEAYEPLYKEVEAFYSSKFEPLTSASLAKFVIHRPGVICEEEGKPLILQDYAVLIQKLRKQTPTPIPLMGAPSAVTLKSHNRDFQDQFKDWVSKFIPSSLNKKVASCRRPLNWVDFHRVLSSVEYLENQRYNPVGQSDEDFEDSLP